MPARKSQNRKQNGGARATMAATEMRQVKTLKNGAQGRYKIENGKRVFRITKGASAAQMARVRSARGKAPRALSAKAARAALTRHFNRKNLSPRGRAIAMGREMCNATRPVVRDTRYSRKGGPVRFNYPGLDDGSDCKGTVRREPRKASAKQAAALAKGRATRARNLRAVNRSPVKRSPVKRSPVKQTPVKRSPAKRAQVDPFKRRGMVFVALPRGNDVTGLNSVGQIVEKSRDGQKVALRLNYNGQLLFRDLKYLRAATAEEKRKDKKEHSRELTIDQEERDILNR